MSDLIQLTRDGHTASILVNRPEARNALSSAMRAELRERFEELAQDSEVRVVTLRGAGGKTFISGADIAEFSALKSAADVIQMARADEELYRAIETGSAASIAVIEGYALGGGLMLAAVCDLRVCTEDARFGITSAKSLSNCLSPGMYARLAALLGHARLKELLICARLLDAQTALAWGLVTEVVPRADLDARVAELTAELAGNAPLTNWATKESLRRLVAGYPADEDILERVVSSDDFAEGVTAFLEKRRPVWRGR